MQRSMYYVVSLILISAFTWAADVSVFFSPKGGCTEAVVKLLDNEVQGDVLVSAYYLTSLPIMDALVRATQRGVVLQVVLDASQAKRPECVALDAAGALVRIDRKHAIMHDKVMIIDGKIVVTGSFNFTGNAEKSNAENLLIIRDRDVAYTYTADWLKHWDHSGL